MGKLLMLAIIGLLLLLPVLAVEPTGSTSMQAWVSVDRADFSADPPYIKLRAYYTVDTIVSSNQGNGVGGSDVFRSESRPLTGATLALTFDGQILTDKYGQAVCQNLVTAAQSKLDTPGAVTAGGGLAVDAGEAVCWGSGQFYARNPDPAANGKPRLLTNWTGCGMLQVKLVSSPEQGSIQSLHATAMMYCPSQPRNLGLYNLLGLSHLSPALIGACLPIFLVLGLLLASMYQRGKDPLMLFDITTPRLPTMRKVRMKPVTQPYHLAGKGRMADRVISRSEKGIAASVFALYGGRKAGETAAKARAEAMALFPKEKTMDAEQYRKAMERLHEIMNKAGAKNETRDRAWAAAMRLMQVREAMLIDKEAHLYARTPEAGLSRKVSKYATDWGVKLAKPWKFFWKDTEKADWFPGIPYVERTGMVISGWLASRAGNVALRRQIRQTALAEVGVATGLLRRDSKFAKQHTFENKRLGHIPHIVEKLRNESYLLGRLIMDEHLRALMTAAVMEQEEKGGFKIKETRMREILKIVEKAQREATKDGVVDQLYMRLVLSKDLALYFQNNNIAVYNAMGEVLEKEQRAAFLKQFNEHMDIVFKTLKADGQATRDGMLPAFNEAAKKMNPDDVYGRYNRLVDLTAVYAKDAREGAGKGRVPMVYLGHDLAEVLGRAVSMRHLEGDKRFNIVDEGSRLMHIRYRMEEEVMRRRFFEYMMGERGFKDKDGRTSMGALGRDGMLNTAWIKELRSALEIEKIREPFEYAKRSEWAARNYLTGYNASAVGYSVEAERNKIEILRQGLAFATTQGYETFYRNYWTQVERNQLTYLTMKEMSKFYTGNDWNADGYEAWKKRGVTYGDVQKGVWLIGGERVLTPLPSGIYRDEQGRIVGAFLRPERLGDVERVGYNVQTKIGPQSYIGKDGKLMQNVYEHSAYSTLMSDYADRPINLSLLFRTADGRSFKPGSPMDRETRKLSEQLQAAWADLTGPVYGVADVTRYRTEEEKRKFLDGLQRAAGGELEARVTGRELSREQALANIRRIENMLYDRVRMTTRSSLKDDPDQSWQTRLGGRATQFLERVMRGGATETDERLHQWYASQAYARTVLQTFGKDIYSEQFYSKEVQDSLNAKKELGKLREDQLKLLSEPRLTLEKQQRLAELRTDIAKQMQDVQRLEQDARKYQKENLYVDRQLKRVADLWIPFYNTAEQTNMRDPRVAWGGGYAMGPAMMVGYQTGQFVGERPQMWAGQNINPGDRMINVLARPSQWAATVFGAHTRTFFTKMTGYTTVYHVDPEHGISGRNTHEQGVVEAFQSLFKPSQTIGLLTRLNLKPLVRGFTPSRFKNEFGWDITEEGNWVGKYYNWPISFRSGGPKAGAAEPINPFDEDRYRLMGLDAAKAKRQTKTGLTFREEYMLWDQRDKAEFQQTSDENVKAMRQRLNTLTDPTERRMLNYSIREMENTRDASRKAWKMPILGAFSRQGYYGVENRSDWDQALMGGAHRPWEMMSPYHKNIDSGMVPGMIGPDREGYMQPYPRVARTISGAWEFIGKKGEQQSRMYEGAPKGVFGSSTERYQTSPLAGFEKMEYGINPSTGRAEIGLGMRKPWLGAAGSGDYLASSGAGRDLFRDALRDVYRRETPLLPKMLQLETDRQSWSFQNSQFVIPLAPLYLGVYHIFRHSSKWAREQAWNSEHRTERDYGELTEAERNQHQRMMREMERQGSAGAQSYACPAHGIHLRVGQACPLCRSDEELKREKEQAFLKRAPGRKREQFKDWARSWLSLAPGLPGYYNNYMDQAHCSRHSIGYPRGTACPLCMEGQVRASRSEEERRKMEGLNNNLKDYAKKIQAAYDDKKKFPSELARGREIAKLVADREQAVQDLGIAVERDTRIGFRPGRAYLQAEMEKRKKEEKDYEYKLAI